MAVRIYRDTLSPSLADTIRLNGAPADLSGATVRFRMRPVGAGTLTVDQPAAVITATAGTVRYDWQPGDLATAGEYLGWWSTTLSNGDTQDSSEFLVIVAAHDAGGRLCSLAEVKAADRAGLDNAGSSLDDVIEQLITDASDAIMEWTGRRYVPRAGAASARTFVTSRAGTGGVVPVHDLAAAPTLVRVLDETGTLIRALTTGDWRAEPLDRDASDPVTGIRLLRVWPQPGDLLEVTGVWGWPAVPRRVARACVLTVLAWLRDNRALTPQSPDQFEPGGTPQRMLPLAARDLLMMDRRLGIA